MSVISFKEIHNGRDGEDQLSPDGKQVSRYTRVFRAVTDDATDEAATILVHASCPGIGAVYPDDPRAYCQRVRPRNESFSKKVWIVTCSYSTERELAENPLNEPAKISWSTTMYTRPIVAEVAGPRAGQAIVNSAGFVFDPPPECDDGRWGANIRKNVANVPDWLGKYKHAINIDAFTLDGLPIGVRRAKMSAIEISEVQERSGVLFRVLSMRIDLNEDTWILEILDCGFYEIDPDDATKRTPINDADGRPTSEPWLLNGVGRALENPSPASAEYISAHVYRELPFGGLPLS